MSEFTAKYLELTNGDTFFDVIVCPYDQGPGGMLWWELTGGWELNGEHELNLLINPEYVLKLEI